MSHEIIELRPEKPDHGEIRYTFSEKPKAPESSLQRLIAQAFGVALGVGIFLLLLFFFVYFVLPLVLIFFLWVLIKKLFYKNS